MFLNNRLLARDEQWPTRAQTHPNLQTVSLPNTAPPADVAPSADRCETLFSGQGYI